MKMMVGRCMSKSEANTLAKTGTLDTSESFVPVFDANRCVEDRLNGMKKDERKNYFHKIGVRCMQRIIFFDVDPNTNIIGPVPQKNGLREYKIPSGTHVDIKYAYGYNHERSASLCVDIVTLSELLK